MAAHVQLNHRDHADLRVATAHRTGLGDDDMACAVFPSEMRDAQACYPVVFAKDPSAAKSRPMALLGFERGENLFLTGEKWDAPYIPLSIRMRPFLIGVTAGADASGMEVHIDIDHPRVGTSDGERLFNEQGEPTPFLGNVTDVLGAIHAGEQTVAAFSAALEEHNLLEPFSLDITLADGSTGRLAGYHTIAEEKLYSLGAEALGRLQAAGYLQPIYMAVASLSQFRSLIDRRNDKILGVI